MGIKSFRPVTPSLRNTTVLSNDEITKKSPEKSLLAPLRKMQVEIIVVKLQLDIMVVETEENIE